MPDSKTILFVYNLDSGVLQSLHDYSGSKSAASHAGACPLTKITHSPLGIKKEWKRFLKDLKIPSRSLDRDEFIGEFGQRQITFPVVLLNEGAALSLILSTEEIGLFNDLSDLISIIEKRIALA
jgi:hypothetical protein